MSETANPTVARLFWTDSKGWRRLETGIPSSLIPRLETLAKQRLSARLFLVSESGFEKEQIGGVRRNVDTGEYVWWYDADLA
jgi:hypothetical protein